MPISKAHRLHTPGAARCWGTCSRSWKCSEALIVWKLLPPSEAACSTSSWGSVCERARACPPSRSLSSGLCIDTVLDAQGCRDRFSAETGRAGCEAAWQQLHELTDLLSDNRCWRGCAEREPTCTAGGSVNCHIATVENSAVVPHKIKNRTTT